MVNASKPSPLRDRKETCILLQATNHHHMIPFSFSPVATGYLIEIANGSHTTRQQAFSYATRFASASVTLLSSDAVRSALNSPATRIEI